MMENGSRIGSSNFDIDALNLSECNNLPEVIEIALAAGKKLRMKLEEMRFAVESGNNDQVLEIARNICSLN